jgi:hypothetical protein
MVHAYERGKETFDSIKLWEFLDELSEYSLLKKDSFSLSW